MMSRWKPDAAGRLAKAALTLFEEQGYAATTVDEIAAAAGLTKRTFFRHFANKREVLFSGSSDLQRLFLDAVVGAPATAGPIDAVAAAFAPVGQMFAGRQPFARIRAQVIAANPELQERELIKLDTLTAALAGALRERGVPEDEALLAAETGVRVFHVAFARWIAQDDPEAFERLMREALQQLRQLVA
jgi:AcrR family transcriptional regulator